jgi:hypothetical protein
MIKRIKPFTEVKLWKDNMISEEYTMSILEFKAKFFDWLRKQDKNWCNYYGSRAAICEFIDKELKSVVDFNPDEGIDDYGELSKLIQDEFWNIVEKELA